jgi:putative DNA primase/helicase
VPVPQGKKGPRHPGWNQPGGYFTSALAAARHWDAHPKDNMGVLLGASALVSLDVDEPVLARLACRAVGLDLGALLGEAVRLAGRPQRERALFVLPEPRGLERRVLAWPGQQARSVTLFELRAGAVQDLLPPSVHPGTGAPYRWLRAPWQVGRIPDLPGALLALWQGWDDLRPDLEAACPWRQLEERGAAPGAVLERRDNQERDPEGWDEIRHQLRRRLPLEAMLAKLGAERRGGSYLCPFHQESHPSFWTFDTGEGYELWVDAHGGAPVGRRAASGYSVGDVIDIYQALHGLPSPGKAAAELARVLGLIKEGDG